MTILSSRNLEDGRAMPKLRFSRKRKLNPGTKASESPTVPLKVKRSSVHSEHPVEPQSGDQEDRWIDTNCKLGSSHETPNFTDSVFGIKECLHFGMDLRILDRATKIGEGVYGEVFSIAKNGSSVVLKVIPIEGTQKINSEVQKTFEGILPEVIITRELSDLRKKPRSPRNNETSSFIELKRFRLLKGNYHPGLLLAWDDYDKALRSQNERPDRFKANQLFIVFEFRHGGCSLERFRFNHPNEGKSLLAQLSWGLAVAEEALEFEHRDLHIGNVLIERTRAKTVSFKLRGSEYRIPTHGIKVNCIDFTNSRVKLGREEEVIYTDLAKDEALFQGPLNEYQFDVYRLMKKWNGNDWKAYRPVSNSMWLHYISHKLMTAKKYSGNPLDDSMKKEFHHLSEKIQASKSCYEIARTVAFF